MADETRAALRQLREELAAEIEADERKHPRWPLGPRCSHCPGHVLGPHKMFCYGPRPTPMEVLAATANWTETGEE